MEEESIEIKDEEDAMPNFDQSEEVVEIEDEEDASPYLDQPEEVVELEDDTKASPYQDLREIVAMEDENIEKAFHILTNSALSGRTGEEEGDDIEANLKELLLLDIESHRLSVRNNLSAREKINERMDDNG